MCTADVRFSAPFATSYVAGTREVLPAILTTMDSMCDDLRLARECPEAGAAAAADMMF